MLFGPRSWTCNFEGCGFYSQLKHASDVYQKLFDIRMELVKSFLKHFTLPNLESNHLYLSTIRPPNETPSTLVSMLTVATTKSVLAWSIFGWWIMLMLAISDCLHRQILKIIPKFSLPSFLRKSPGNNSGTWKTWFLTWFLQLCSHSCDLYVVTMGWCHLETAKLAISMLIKCPLVRHTW